MSSEATQTSLSKPPFPSLIEQSTYGLAGTIAGACTVPIEYSFRRPLATAFTHFIRTVVPPVLYRTGIRFWVFDHVKYRLSDSSPSLPVSFRSGVGGAAGGFMEVLVQFVVDRRRIGALDYRAAGSQALKLFLCFGTYTFLSTSLSEELPPKPFPICWAMGAVAGGVGSGIVGALVDGARGRMLWTGVVPRGAVMIGTVISVQVTSCAAILPAVGD